MTVVRKNKQSKGGDTHLASWGFLRRKCPEIFGVLGEMSWD